MVHKNTAGFRYKGTDTYYKVERLCKICDAHMGFSRYVPRGDKAFCRSCRGKRELLREILTTGDCGASDPEAYNNGEYIGLLIGGSAKLIERFVRLIGKKSNTKTDWSYAGGRGVVQTLGNPTVVRAVLEANIKTRIFPNEPCKYNKQLNWWPKDLE